MVGLRQLLGKNGDDIPKEETRISDGNIVVGLLHDDFLSTEERPRDACYTLQSDSSQGTLV